MNSSVESFADRISWVIDSLGGPGEAAKKIETTYTTLARWKAGKAEPTRSSLIKIAEAANVDIAWLVTGEKLASSSLHEAPANYSAEKQGQIPEFVNIPAYDIEVSAGYGMFSEGAYKPSKHLAFRKRWVSARGLDVNCLAVLFTTGDSMEPTIPENAAIVVDRARNQAMDGKVYVIRVDDRLWVKRTQWLIGGGLRLISDNTFYNPIDITKQDFAANDVEVIGQVIHAAYDLPD